MPPTPEERLHDAVGRAYKLIVPTVLQRKHYLLRTSAGHRSHLPDLDLFAVIVEGALTPDRFCSIVKWLKGGEWPDDQSSPEKYLPEADKAITAYANINSNDQVLIAAGMSRVTSRILSSIALLPRHLSDNQVPTQEWIESVFPTGAAVFPNATAFGRAIEWVEDTANGGSVGN